MSYDLVSFTPLIYAGVAGIIFYMRNCAVLGVVAVATLIGSVVLFRVGNVSIRDENFGWSVMIVSFAIALATLTGTAARLFYRTDPFLRFHRVIQGASLAIMAMPLVWWAARILPKWFS